MSFVKLSTGDTDLDRVQDNVDRQFKVIDGRIAQLGVIVKDVDLTAADKIVNHGLNRAPLGFVVIRSDSPITVYESSSINPRPKQSLILKASGSVTVTLWVF